MLAMLTRPEAAASGCKPERMAKPSKKQQPGVERGTSDTPGLLIRAIDPEGIAEKCLAI